MELIKTQNIGKIKTSKNYKTNNNKHIKVISFKKLIYLRL